MNIILTGTPGTGKTTVGKALAKKLGIPYVDVLSIIKKQRLYSGKYKGSLVVDTKKLEQVLKTKQGVIESHLLCEMKLKGPVFVLRASPVSLRMRLRKKFPKPKVDENIEAEILDYCFIYSKQNYKKVYQVNTTKKRVAQVVSEIVKIIKNPESYKNKTIDWTPYMIKRL